MYRIINIIFVAVMVLTPLQMNAQQKEKTHNHFDKESFLIKRSAFITAELGLTPEEAATFIPLCEELNQKKYEAGQRCRKLSREVRSKINPTDAEYTQVIDECLTVGLKEAELEKEYYERFKKMLSPEKLYKYKDAERKFAREFMKSSREKRKENKDR